jgi:HPt (histidine-containing phosphotransfer) domain-containing protein
MSEVRDPAIIALLAEARAQFATTLPAKIADLRSLLDRGAWDELRRAAHKLRGSTGTYGFMELSTATGDVEDALLEAGGVPGPEVKDRVERRVREATAEAERAAR